MRKSPRIGLAQLCRVARVNQRMISEDDVGFMLAPRVNAASRMGDAFDAFRLLTTVWEDEASTLAKKLDAANRKRKAEAGSITRAVHTRLGERTTLPSVIALGDPLWRPALLGLVANTIAEEFERPVFLWGREGNNTIKGSMRSAGKVHGLELMEAANHAFDQFGGHAAAGGFAVAADALFDLEERLTAAYERITKAGDDTDAIIALADAVVTPEEIVPAFLTRLETLAPFGIDNPKPVFLVRDVVVEGVTRFGKSGEHLKIEIGRARTPLSAVAFFAKGALSRAAEQTAPPYRAHLLGHLERDTFSRGQPVRMRLLSIKPI
jgi:single-stranded-DNA-specific exonuclease